MAHQQHQSCIQACDACAAACDHCAAACLSEPDAAQMVECIRHDMDCADICRLASAVMARGSRRAKELCSLCASICDACAAECEKHQHEHCKQCAEASELCEGMPGDGAIKCRARAVAMSLAHNGTKLRRLRSARHSAETIAAYEGL